MDCPDPSCNGRMIGSHSINEEAPINLKCDICEAEGNEKYWYESHECPGSIYYKIKIVEKNKPSDFKNYSWDSVARKSESEVIAQNIMKILSRKGDVFPEELLTFEQYKEARLEDGNFSEGEKYYFDQVIGYCKSADTAKLFSKSWRE